MCNLFPALLSGRWLETSHSGNIYTTKVKNAASQDFPPHLGKPGANHFPLSHCVFTYNIIRIPTYAHPHRFTDLPNLRFHLVSFIASAVIPTPTLSTAIL